MASLLIQNAARIVSMDDAHNEWTDAGIYVEENVIQQIGPIDHLPRNADRVIDARNMIILPGLVNTHHHFYQTLTRNLPQAQDANLFQWLRIHYPIWAGLTPEAIAVSTKIAIAELMLSGCKRRAIIVTSGPTVPASTTRSRLRARWPFASMPRAARCR